jgi:tRNA A-37 threonylcarbamoyl transferase component Bud32
VSDDRESGDVRTGEPPAAPGAGSTVEPGDVIGGRYEVERELGGGATGNVYLVHDRLLKKQIALKMLHPELAESRDTVRRFLREVALAHSVTHPHVVRIYDTGEDGGRPFFTMEYLSGQTLEEVLEGNVRGERLSLREIREISVDVLDAMEAAHRVGVVHRDLKPGNVMLTHRGAIVMDFGVAGIEDVTTRGTDARPLDSLVRTEAGTIFGSPAYMAPELWEGSVATVQTDLYAFGVMLYQMLTGRLPYEAKTTGALLNRISRPPPPIHAFRRDAPRSLVRLARLCMGREPQGRPASAAAAGNAISPSRGRRRRRLAAGAAIGAALIAGVFLLQRGPHGELGLGDAEAAADLTAAVRSYDAGDVRTALHTLDRLAARAPDAAGLVFWRATIRHEIHDELGRVAACAAAPGQGSRRWVELAEAACGESWSLPEWVLPGGGDEGDATLLPLAIRHILVPRIEAAGDPGGPDAWLGERLRERLARPDIDPWPLPNRALAAGIDLDVALGRVDEAMQRASELADVVPEIPLHVDHAAWLALERGEIDRARELADAQRPFDPTPVIRMELEAGRLDRAWQLVAAFEGDPRSEPLRAMWCGYAYRFEATTVPRRCTDLAPSLARALWAGPMAEATDLAPLDPLERTILERQRALDGGECDDAVPTALLTHAPSPFELYVGELGISAALCSGDPQRSDLKRARQLATALAGVAPDDPWALLVQAQVDEALGSQQLARAKRLAVAERWHDADEWLPLVGRLREAVGGETGAAAVTRQ